MKTPLCTAARRWLLAAVGAAFVAFQVYTALFGFLPNIIQRAVHLSFALAMIGGGRLLAPRIGTARSWARWLFALGLAFGVGADIFIIAHFRTYIGSPMQTDAVDTLGAAGLVLAVFLASGTAVGWSLPVMAAVFWAYGEWGAVIPGSWGHKNFDIGTILETVYHTTHGIYGQILGISATTVAVFVMLGTMLVELGATQILFEVAGWVAGRARGGTAKIAVIASSLFAMINGSAAANSASVGSITIPTMIRSGTPPMVAGAVEAVSGSGGQLVPPIMGAASFLMAEFLGLPHSRIAEAGLFPALCYYTAAFSSVHFTAVRLGLKSGPAPVHLEWEGAATLRRWVPLPLALVTLGAVWALGFTVEFAGAVALLASCAFDAACRLLEPGKRFRERLAEAIRAYARAAERAAASTALIAVLLACAQLIVLFVNMTGVGVKVASAIVGFSGGQLLPAALLAAFVGLVLGTGMPTTAEYVLAAAVTAPALIQLGALPLAAHMFIFYYAVMATLTPPVGASAFISAGIARVSWYRVSGSSFRLVAGGFLIPLVFLIHPQLLSFFIHWSAADATYAAAALVGIVALSWGLSGAGRSGQMMGKAMVFAGGVGLMWPVAAVMAAGAMLCAAGWLWCRRGSAVSVKPAS